MFQIYKIRVPLTDQAYIGYTTQTPTNLFQQLRSQLKRGVHHCKSLQEAAQAHGVRSLEFEVLATSPAVPEVQTLVANYIAALGSLSLNTRVPAVHDKSVRGREVGWNGVTYPSLREAAKANTLTEAQLRYRLGWGYAQDSDVVMEQFQGPAIPCEWGGATYQSIRAASLATGIPYSTMQRYQAKGVVKK